MEPLLQANHIVVFSAKPWGVIYLINHQLVNVVGLEAVKFYNKKI
jgi:hypothetical protein